MAWAGPNSFVYQGQIIKSNGQPLSGLTTFKLQILSPGTERCVLYEETHSVNMTGSEGVFSLAVGNGSRFGSQFQNTSQLVNVFRNNQSYTGLSHCDEGANSYTPSGPNDRRKLRLAYNDGSGEVTIPLDHNILSVPFAWDAKTIEGMSPNQFLRVNPIDNVTQDNLEDLFAGSNYLNLLNLAQGSSTQYVGAGTNGAHIPSYAADPGAPIAGSMWLNTTSGEMKYFNGSTVQVVGAGGGGGGGPLVEADIPTLLTGGKVIGTAITSGEISGTTSINTSGNLITTGNVDANEVNATVVNGTTVNATSVVTTTMSSTAASARNLDIYDSDNSHRVRIQAPATGDLTANYNLTLPTTAGSNGLVLQTNGTGVLSWVENVPDDSVTTAKIQDGAVTDAKIDSVLVGKVSNALGQYFNYMPDGGACGVGQVLKWSAMPQGWVCGDDDGGVGTISAINTNMGSALTGGGNSGALTLSVVTDGTSIGVNGNALQVVDGGISTAKLNDNAVTTAKVADGAITNAKLANDSVSTNQIVNGAVTDAKITSVSVDKVTSALGQYFGYAPNGTACTDGQVLKWNNADTRWECGSDNDTNTDAVTSVFGRSGVVIAEAGDYTATQITNTPAGGITATTVQAALDELDAEKFNATGGTISGNVIVQGAITSETSITLNDQTEIRFADSDSSNYVALRAPATVGSNVTWTLPAADGLNGQVLSTNGSGVLAWSTASAGSVTEVATGSGLTGGPITGAGTIAIATGGVTSSHIADGTIATEDLADDSITTAKLQDNSVTTDKIQDGAITNAKIDSVSVNKITSALGQYFSYAPNGTTCADGQVLKWNDSDTRWECGDDTDTNTSAVTSVFGRSGVVTATAGDYTATQITNTPAGGIASTNVQTALNELDTEKVNRAGDTITGALTVQGLTTVESHLQYSAQGEARFADSDSSNYVALRAPATVGSNVTWTLPAADGLNGQVLSTNGGGVLAWSNASAGSVTEVATGSGLTGGPINSTGTIAIATGGVTSSHIADGTIATADLANASVTSDKLADGSVGTAKVQDAAITDAKIHQMSVNKITSSLGQYLTYMPDGGACDVGQTLKWQLLPVAGWICADDAQGSGADDLGNHVATQNIDLGTYQLVGNGGSEGIAVANNGRVGIGTTSPSARLHVNGVGIVGGNPTSSAGALIVKQTEDTNAGGLVLERSGTTATGRMYIDSSNIFHFYRANNGHISMTSVSGDFLVNLDGSERLRVQGSTGNLGVGVTGPSAKLEVRGQGRFSDAPGSYIHLDSNQDLTGLNPGTSTAMGGVIEGPANKSLILDLKNNNADDSFAIRYSAANSAAVDAIGFVMRGNGRVGIGTSTPGVALDVSGHGDAIRLPAGADGARPGSPANGMIRYSTTSNKFEAYENGAWVNMISTGVANGSIGTTQLADGSVTTAKLANLAVTDAKLAADAVTTTKIANGAVTDAKIATVSVNKITSALGQYLTYQPNGSACVDGGVLKWNGLTGWECGTDSNSGGDVLLGGNTVGATMVIGTNSNHSLGLETQGTTKMTILADGNVGIGTASPNNKLHVNGGLIQVSNTGQLAGTVMERTDGSAATYYAGQTFSAVMFDSGYDFAFRSQTRANVLSGNGGGSTSRLTIRGGNGRVGVGVDAPAVGLDVSGHVDAVRLAVGATGDRPGTPSNGMIRYNTTTNKFEAYENGAWTNVISSAGADNLGNHTATQNINLATYQLVGAGGTSGVSILNNGNVGIGTTSPGTKLDIQASDVGTRARVRNTSSTAARYPGYEIINYAGTAGGSPTIYFANLRGNASTSGALQASDYLGSYEFWGGSDTVHNARQGATIYAQAAANFSNTSSPTNLIFGTTATGQIWPSESMRINSTGRVGIGSSSPEAKLHVSDAATIDILGRFDQTGAENGYVEINAPNNRQASLAFMGGGNYLWEMGKQNDNSFYMWDQARTRDFLRVNSSGNLSLAPVAGNVGVGIGAPSTKLHVRGTGELLRVDTSSTDFLRAGIDASGSYLESQASTNVVRKLRMQSYDGVSYSQQLEVDGPNKRVHIPAGDLGLGDGYFSLFKAYGGDPTAALRAGGHGSYGFLELFMSAANDDGNVPYLSLHRGGQTAWQMGMVGNNLTFSYGGGPQTHDMHGPRPLTVTTTSRVGINNTNPSVDLHVGGAIAATQWIGAGCEGSCEVSGGYSIMYPTQAAISTFGWTTTSDRRLKKDIEAIENPLAKLLEIHGVTYYWQKTDIHTNREVGVIAQDVQSVFPEAVHKTHDGYLTVDYARLVAPLIEGVREIYHQLLALTSRVENSERGLASVQKDLSLALQQKDKEIATLKAQQAEKERQMRQMEERLQRLEKALAR